MAGPADRQSDVFQQQLGEKKGDGAVKTTGLPFLFQY